MKDVADFIMRRNDYDFDFNNLWISTGASEGIEMFMRLLIEGSNDRIILLVPRYRFYNVITLL